MTINTHAGQTTKNTEIARAERLLRDAAFVLRMTRRVKNEILHDAARPNSPSLVAADRAPAALGV